MPGWCSICPLQSSGVIYVLIIELRLRKALFSCLVSDVYYRPRWAIGQQTVGDKPPFGVWQANAMSQSRAASAGGAESGTSPLNSATGAGSLGLVGDKPTQPLRWVISQGIDSGGR